MPISLEDIEAIQEQTEELLGDDVVTNRIAAIYPANRSDEEILAEVEPTYKEFYE